MAQLNAEIKDSTRDGGLETFAEFMAQLEREDQLAQVDLDTESDS